MIAPARQSHNPCGEVLIGIMAICTLKPERRLRRYLQLAFKYRAYRKRLRRASRLLTCVFFAWCAFRLWMPVIDVSWGWSLAATVVFLVVQVWVAHLEVKTHEAEANVIRRAAR